MKVWISRRVGYYTVFTSQRSAIFSLSLQKIAMQHCGPGWGSGKEHEIGGKGAGHKFWKNEIARGHNISQLKSNGSKMTDKSDSSKPWSSICKLNGTPRGESVIPQLLEWSSHLLAYEIVQPIKTTNTTFHGCCIYTVQWPTLLECAFLWI